MITIINEQEVNDSETLPEISLHENEEEANSTEVSIANALTHFNPTTQQLLSSKIILHTPDAGLNSLVDAAAYLFSIMGKLKHIKSYRRLDKLSVELTQAIEDFQQNASTCGNAEYMAEYIPVACYALCVTLDDIITNTAWGSQGAWDKYSLLVSFNQASISRDSFFIILERLISDPEHYIDLMEFMYICLSLGFKGHYNHSTFDHEQLEQIINALYKRIRAYRGDFSKILSPFIIKPRVTSAPSFMHKLPIWLVTLLSINIIIGVFAGARYLIDISSNQTYQNLSGTEKTVPYETHTESPTASH
jgi:type VI secretion system protein ImpK